MAEESLPANWLRPLGRTGLTVSAICLGGSPLGSMPSVFGYEVDERTAVDLVRALFDSPINFIDTANGYSDGDSERRIGRAISESGGVPDGVVIQTKVDARGSDYSGDRVRRSVAESLERLGLDALPLVHLHDPEFHDFDDLVRPGGAVDALVALRDEGVIGHLGVAGGDVRVMHRYLDLGVFEVLLTHNRWTIVDRSAGELITSATERGVAVLNAAVYGGGILADPSGGHASYGYRPVRPQTLAAIRAMSELATEAGTDLATVALAWSLSDQRVSSTIVGFTKPQRIEGLLAAATLTLPLDFWDRLEALVPGPDSWLDNQAAR